MKKNLKLAYVLIIVFLLGVIGVLLFYVLRNNSISLNRNEIKKEEILIEEEGNVAENEKKGNVEKDIEIQKNNNVLEKGNIFFVERKLLNDGMGGEKIEFFLYNINTKEKKKIISLDGVPFRNSFYYKNQIYFINENKDLSSLDLNNLKIESLNIGDRSDNSIASFLIGNNQIFYLKGPCNFIANNECSVGSYDLSSGENNGIFNNIGNEKLKITKIVYFSKNKNSIILRSGFGDGGVATADFYELNLNDNSFKKIAETNYEEACEHDIDDLYCTNKGLIKNKEFKNLENKYKIENDLGCNGNKVDFDKIYKDLNITDVDHIRYIGCIE